MIRRRRDATPFRISVWIDTAFDGHLVLPTTIVQQLELESLIETEAILADGRTVTLQTYVCYLDWLDECIPLQVICNDGSYPLLCTELLKQRILHID